MKFSKETRNVLVTIVGTILLSLILVFLPIDYQSFGNWGYLGLFLTVCLGSATIVFPTPAFAASFIAGRFLNPYMAGIVAGIGATIGELVGYFLGYESASLVRHKNFYQHVYKFTKRYGVIFLIFFSMIPNTTIAK